MHRQTVLDQGTLYPVVTIAKAVEAFLTDCHIRQISPKTTEFYTKKLKRFLAFCEGQAITRLDQVEVGLLRQFFLWLEENGNNAGGRHAVDGETLGHKPDRLNRFV
jgi:site-specific recombinase XerC